LLLLLYEKGLNGARDIKFDTAGNLYIANSADHTILKRVVAGTTSTICGSSENSGSSGDNNLAVNAKLNNPSKIAIDSKANIYIADTDNNKIRKITVNDGASKINTIVGSGSTTPFIDNVDALSATLNTPTGIDVDSIGNLYIADTSNKRIRFVNVTSNIITTLVGDGVTNYSPQDVKVDIYGRIYFTDSNFNQV
jgi:hypothetical protein